MTTGGTERPLPGVTGIVLAGGRSSRFGSDKLRAEIGGRTLFERAIGALAAVAADVVVVGAPDDDQPLPAASVAVRRVADPAAHLGPLVGLRTGLEAAAEPIVLVIGGDMPSVRPAVLAALGRALLAAPDDVNAAVLASKGRLVPLPAALRTGAATDRVGRLVEDGERRLRSVFERFPTRVLDEAEWRPLDPDGETLIDVDRPSDLPGE
jgi:molybdopterin-guanine dinucleotide biosynthesis protein A